MQSRFLIFPTLYFLGAVFLQPLFCFAQKNLKTVTQTGEYQMRIEKTMSEADATNKCIEQARIAAIRNAFGDVIFQGNSTYIKNVNTGEKTETQNVFNFYSDTHVNGEWIKDIGKPKIEKVVQNNETWLTVTLKCEVRELKPSVINFSAKPASCPDVKCQTEQFNNGQDFFLIFKAPVNGYLSVYLDVPGEEKTYRILPYKQFATEGSVSVKADEDYIFFAKKNDKTDKSSYVDEMVLALTQEGISESNKLFILFSPREQLGKPMLSNIAETESQKQITKSNFELPSHLPSEEFQKWLQQLRSRNSEIQLSFIYINIKP